jgi:hypothetical protein
VNRLIVQAAIHPTTIARVLVYVELEDGSTPFLSPSNFKVDMWATNQSPPGGHSGKYPAVLSAWQRPDSCYELELDNHWFNEEDPTETRHEPFPTYLNNVVYLVSVSMATPEAQGRCIVTQRST